jgi:hypothetical protein
MGKILRRQGAYSPESGARRGYVPIMAPAAIIDPATGIAPGPAQRVVERRSIRSLLSLEIDRHHARTRARTAGQLIDANQANHDLAELNR